MAFLLLLHQKMRLQRKQNQLTLKQLRYSSLVERMQKKVDKREKYYSKLEKQLERQANAYKNSANMFFSQQMGLGTNGINLGNYTGSSAAALQILKQWNGTNPYASDKNNASFDSDLCQAIMMGELAPIYDKNNTLLGYDTNPKAESPKYQKEQYQAAQQIINLANSSVSQMQAYASQMKANYENNVSIWLEAQQEELEARKEWEMDLLAEEQADLEAEKTSIEAQLELVKQEKESVQSQLAQAAQDAAPKFGLA